MTDQTIKHISTAGISLSAVTVIALVAVLTDFDVSRLFVASLLANFLASGLLVGLSAALLPRYLRHIRRPRLQARASFERNLSPDNTQIGGTISLGIHNLGDTTIDRFYWHLMIPRELNPEVTVYSNGDHDKRAGTKRMRGYEYEYVKGYFEAPIFPGDGVEIPMKIRISGVAPDLLRSELRCAFSTEFGQFPREMDQHGEWTTSALADCEKVEVRLN